MGNILSQGLPGSILKTINFLLYPRIICNTGVSGCNITQQFLVASDPHLSANGSRREQAARKLIEKSLNGFKVRLLLRHEAMAIRISPSMKKSTSQPFWKRIIQLALVGFFLSPHLLSATDIKVFTLHSYSQEYPWTKSENEGFVTTLNHLLKARNISYVTEYLDSKRLRFTEKYQDFMKDYLQEKYADYAPDIVFLTDDNALLFYMRYQRELFQDTPVVFCGVNDTSMASTLESVVFHGVFEVKDATANLQLARKFLPDAGKIYFVGDNSVTFTAIRQQIQENNRALLTITPHEFITDTHISVVKGKLAELQRGILLLTTIGGFRDDFGNTLSIAKAVAEMRESGDFILMSMEDVYMHEGVLGGVVTSGEAQGAAAGEMAYALLSNKEAVTERFITGANTPKFSYPELQRNGISLSRLPPNAEILDRPLSLYQEFREIVVISGVAFALLLVLLIFLSLSVIKRKKAERDLQASESFLSSVLDNLPDMIFVKDARNLRFIDLNRAGERIFGVGREGVLGKTDYDFFPREEADFFTEKDRQTLRRKELVDIPRESIQTPAGTRYLHTKKIPILDAKGHPSYLLGISRDITEEIVQRQKRKELEEKLKQAQKMESIGTLAGGIAHDFNNILSSIIGYTELAQRQANQPEVVEKLLGGTLKGAERAKLLVRQILTFSRKGEAEMVPVVLADVVQEGLALLRSSLPSTITITEQLNNNSRVLADPTQMHQIIMNLGTNGYQAMLETGGTLVVVLEQEEITSSREVNTLGISPGSYLHLSIQDTGRGMEKETLERMFDPYFTTKGPEAGTGLGLAVVHGIVKNHGGSISVISELDIGTTVDIYLPVTEKEPEAEEPLQLPEHASGGTESILLVDDESDITSLIESFLGESGYRVKACNSSVEALLEFRNNPHLYDLVISDMTMPKMTGMELSREILAIHPEIPIVLCTGHSDSVNRAMALASGISAYCEKPMNLEELLATVRRLLDAD